MNGKTLGALAALPLLALTACATSEAMTARMAQPSSEEAARYLAAAPVGDPVSCLSTHQIRQTEGLSGNAILFETVGGDLFRNELNASCPGARRDASFSYRIPGPRLCRGEILQFFDPFSGMEYGACSLGDFVPIEDPDDMDAAE
ncbi:MAG: hypothetical protein V2J26_10885 [Pacificimonas sp.]|jgi:hypothetical protein|nr:hypothetical protein [Pacificimonas sp.]